MNKYNHNRQVQLNSLESNFKLQQTLHVQKHKKYRGEAPLSTFKDHIQLRKFDMRKMEFTEDKTDDFQTLFEAAKKEKSSTTVINRKKKYNDFKEFKISRKFLQPPPMPVALYIARFLSDVTRSDVKILFRGDGRTDVTFSEQNYIKNRLRIRSAAIRETSREKYFAAHKGTSIFLARNNRF